MFFGKVLLLIILIPCLSFSEGTENIRSSLKILEAARKNGKSLSKKAIKDHCTKNFYKNKSLYELCTQQGIIIFLESKKKAIDEQMIINRIELKGIMNNLKEAKETLNDLINRKN